KIRTGHQRPDRADARPHHSAFAARHRRRGDRVIAKMKRREFIGLLGGATAAWPLPARAQQPRRMRRIGVLTPLPADDAEGHAEPTAFTQALQQSGWTVGQNVRIDYRWGPGNPSTMRKYATELVSASRTSSWPLAAPPSRRYWRQPALSQSYSRLFPT